MGRGLFRKRLWLWLGLWLGLAILGKLLGAGLESLVVRPLLVRAVAFVLPLLS